jgi:hypothetical protein
MESPSPYIFANRKLDTICIVTSNLGKPPGDYKQ